MGVVEIWNGLAEGEAGLEIWCVFISLPRLDSCCVNPKSPPSSTQRITHITSGKEIKHINRQWSSKRIASMSVYLPSLLAPHCLEQYTGGHLCLNDRNAINNVNQSSELVTNRSGESWDSSCEKSWVPVQNQWVPVQKTSSKLKLLGRQTPKLCFTDYWKKNTPSIVKHNKE